MHSRLARGRFHALLVAALVGSLSLAVVPGSSGASPAPPGSDRVAAASTSTGTWQVTRTGAGTYQVTWRSPRRLPVTSDRATIVLDGVPIGVPLLRADGRTVVTTVRAARAARPGRPRRRAVGRPARPRRPRRDRRDGPATRPRRSPQLADDPAEPGEYAVVYRRLRAHPGQAAADAEPIEMVGHVVEPDPAADTGPRPLVVFLHGRHSYCYNPTDDDADGWDWPCQAPLAEIPSHLGYDYIQQVLASQGFTTVSIRVNGINAQDYRLSDGGADARAQIVQEHLDHWTEELAVAPRRRPVPGRAGRPQPRR